MTTPVETAKSNEHVRSEFAAAAYPYVLDSNNAELIRKWGMFDHLLQAAILLHVRRAVQIERDAIVFKERRERGQALTKALKSQLDVLRKALAASSTFSNTAIPQVGRLGDLIGNQSLPAVLEAEIELLEEALRQSAITFSEKRFGVEKHPLWLLEAELVVKDCAERQGVPVSLTADDLATLIDVIHLTEGLSSANPTEPATVRTLMARFVKNPKNAKIVKLRGFRKRGPDNPSSVKDTKTSKS